MPTVRARSLVLLPALVVCAVGCSSGAAGSAGSASAPSTTASRGMSPGSVARIKGALLTPADIPLHVAGTTTLTGPMAHPPMRSSDPSCTRRLDAATTAGRSLTVAYVHRNFALGPAVGAFTEDVTEYRDGATANEFMRKSIPLQRQCPQTTIEQGGHRYESVVESVSATATGYVTRVAATADGGPSTAMFEAMHVVGPYWVLVTGQGPRVTEQQTRAVASRAATRLRALL